MRTAPCKQINLNPWELLPFCSMVMQEIDGVTGAVLIVTKTKDGL
jgi:endogenous inhibitor of DNA gyrase (YacG/DUF329 family)